MTIVEHSTDATDYRRSEVEKGHKRGWSFTPLRGKRPFKKKWQAAPREPIEEALAFAQGNVGLRTGAASDVVVIDVDMDKGGSVDGLDLPRTVTAETGGGGQHRYFKRPSRRIGNSTGKLAAHVDVRAEGGVVAFVGCIHPRSKAMYRWADGLSPGDVDLAELPEHIITLLIADSPSASVSARDHVQGVLDKAIEKVCTATKGIRNDTLNRMAFRLGKLVGTGDLDETEVLERLRQAAHQAGLNVCEIEATLRSGLDAGSREARASRKKGLPVIRIKGGDLPELIEAGEDALMASKGHDLYEFGGLPVLLVRQPRIGIGLRPWVVGVLTTVPVDALYLAHSFTSVANWEKFDARMGIYKPVDCPPKVAATYLSLAGRRKIPTLTGVISAPTLRVDGSILDEPGYDPVSKLFFDPGGTKYGKVPQEPSREDAGRALQELMHVIKDFPFVAPHDRSVALAAILTALIRKSLRTAPMFAIDAPKMSSGKSLLVDSVALIATGSPAAVMSQARDEDESRKRLLAILLEGALVASIDNLERPLSDAGLCSVLTQEIFKDRVLGVSKTATVPTSTCWFATGNNLVIAGDLTSRVVTCRLDPRCERPEEREFDVNLHTFIRDHRARLVRAGLTVLRAFHVAGRPKQDLRVFGRFEEWSDLIRSALVWCGQPDPCLGRKRVEQYDPVRELLRALGLSWYDALGDTPVSANHVLERASQLKGEGNSRLHEALAQITGGKDQPNAIVLGRWLHGRMDRIEGGFAIRRHGSKQGTAQWGVERIDEPNESVGSRCSVSKDVGEASDG